MLHENGKIEIFKKAKALIIMLFTLSFTNNCLGQKLIGLKQFELTDSMRSRNLNVNLLYPVDSNKDCMLYGANRVFQGFKAIKDAKVSMKTSNKKPLIFLIHGTSGNWKSLSWLGSHLASNDALIVSVNHPGSCTGQATPRNVLEIWNQPADISFLIDYFLNSEYSDLIDDNKIIAIGHSLGGYSALSLIGAKLNPEKYIRFSEKNSSLSLQYFRNELRKLDASFKSRMEYSNLDERVDLAIALTPGFIESIDYSTIDSVVKPALILGAELDSNIPPLIHYNPFLKFLPKSWIYQQINGATHFTFLQKCHNNAIEILKESGEEFVCKEEGEKNRGMLHSELEQFVSNFIEEQLTK